MLLHCIVKGTAHNRSKRTHRTDLVLLVLLPCSTPGMPLLVQAEKPEVVSLNSISSSFNTVLGCHLFLCPYISLISTSMSWEDLKWVPLFIYIQFRGYHIVQIHLEYMLLQEEHRGGVLVSDRGSNLDSTSYKFCEHGKVPWHSWVRESSSVKWVTISELIHL